MQQYTIPHPVVPAQSLTTSDRWPGGQYHCAESIGTQIYIFCGAQFDPNMEQNIREVGRLYDIILPKDTFWVFNTKTLQYKRHFCKGLPPRGCMASVKSPDDRKIHLFGGFDDDAGRDQNDLLEFDVDSVASADGTRVFFAPQPPTWDKGTEGQNVF
jgi:hypothetical protein